MKTFLLKFVLASLAIAVLASCSGQKGAVVNMDKTPSSACTMTEPASNITHWEAFKNENVNGMIATYDPKSENIPSVSDLNAFIVAIKKNQITLDKVTWVATCPVEDGNTYSFFLVSSHTPTKKVTQWYILTTNAAGLIENLE